MRQLTAYASYLDNLGAPLVGRARFYNFDDSPAVVYGMDNAHQHYVQLGHIVYTNSSGQLMPQVFLADHDYLVVFDKYIGGGTMAEDDDPESWQEMGSAVDKYNTVGIELDGSAVRSFGTVDALRAAMPVESADGDNEIVELLGYYEPGDKPSIQYQWDPNSSEPDNGGSVLGTGAVGRWKLVECPEFLDVRHFGAFPDQTSEGNAVQRNRVQLAGAYAHFNSCGINFYGDALAVYYDISGLELFKTTSDDLARVYAVSETESTIREVVDIYCGADQFTPLSNQGKITLYGDLLRASFAPNYNVWFAPTRKMVVDCDVATANLEVWDSVVEVTVDTTSHWDFVNCQFESIHHIGNNVTIRGKSLIDESMFKDSTDFSTITVGDSVICDIDAFYTMSNWCKLVKQQSRRDFDIDGRTLDSNCNLSFNDGSTLIIHNARFNGFTFGNHDVNLYSCIGSISYPHTKSLRLFDCSGGISLLDINQNAAIVSRYSQIVITQNMTVDKVNMLGGILSYLGDTALTLSTKSNFEALGTRIYCPIDGTFGNGLISLTDCVVTKDVAGKIIKVRSCAISDSNISAYSPYNGTDANIIDVEAVGNKFIGSSKLRLRTTHSSASATVYDLSFNVCGNFSDHDFVDDSAFNGETHNVNVSKCVYKGNYGGCPSNYGYIPETVNYSKETLEYVQDMSTGPNGTVPASQANNTVKFYIDQRTNPETGWTMNTMWWCLKVNKSLSLDSFNVFRFKNIHVASAIRIRPNCTCMFKRSAPSGESYGESVNEVPMRAVTANVTSSYQYNDSFAVDYGMATTTVGQREQQLLTAVIGATLPQAEAYIEWNVDLVDFVGY